MTNIIQQDSSIFKNIHCEGLHTERNSEVKANNVHDLNIDVSWVISGKFILVVLIIYINTTQAKLLAHLAV